MHISLFALQHTDPRNVLRLAQFMGIATMGLTIEMVIEEIHFQTNYAHLIKGY